MLSLKLKLHSFCFIFFRKWWRGETTFGAREGVWAFVVFVLFKEIKKCKPGLTKHSIQTQINLTTLAITSLILWIIDTDHQLYWQNRTYSRRSLVNHTPFQCQSSQPPPAWPLHRVHMQHPCRTHYFAKGCVNYVCKKQTGCRKGLAGVKEVKSTARSAIVTVHRGYMRCVGRFVIMWWEEQA